jgi:hypothetical protein
VVAVASPPTPPLCMDGGGLSPHGRRQGGGGCPLGAVGGWGWGWGWALAGARRLVGRRRGAVA